MISKLLQGLQVKSSQTRNQQLYRDMLKRESAIGAELFGPIPEGHRRDASGFDAVFHGCDLAGHLADGDRPAAH